MLNTSRLRRRLKIDALLCKRGLTKCPGSTRMTLRGFKVALIGLFLICVATISGCSSGSNQRVEPSKLTVDASLMVTPNLTNEMLSVLSQSD